jgi:catechol 2,3-dioxygenase-like lactoylglutathione lyase family enzyme
MDNTPATLRLSQTDHAAPGGACGCALRVAVKSTLAETLFETPARHLREARPSGSRVVQQFEHRSAAMSHRGFSHLGLSTLDLDKTREFYEGVLGFKAVIADTIRIEEGGRFRHLFFDVGRGQLIAFLEPQGIPGVPTDYDAGINRGLGVPAAFYHFAFEAGSEAALIEKHGELRGKGVEVTDIVDHGWAKSIYFKDPNGLSLEYCCALRAVTQDDSRSFTLPRAALELGNATSAAQRRSHVAAR